ncbi:inositol 2-dehydrogenase [Clostridium sp. JS66]|uniref:inositol 2-dehydrogenase n=1 Tax=Clostridium sp. JS66 TaxID=3064705 RepID=UPI00298D940A|nr:inositol 2-dehydrogenase [Clostridium sp. JS66]WPC42548.1 inositol 2-dehydrogenase [Clostridium sp. JS66]
MLKVGIIGAGRIGRVHGESISKYVKEAEIKAIADPFLNEEQKKWAKEKGIPCAYTDYKKILEDPEIDAVLICSSTDTHSKISIEAIQAHKHVFCEKPIDHDVSRIKEVIEELKKNHSVKYQVGFNRRYDHNFKAVRQAVADGKVGEPHILKITSRDPEPPSIDYVKVSGGMFLDMTIHDFDMVRYLMDSEVVEVYAAGNVLVDKAIGEAGDIDTAIITLKLENGAMAVIDNSRKSAYGYDQRAEVFGSKGQVAISNDSNSSAVVSTENGVTAEKPMFFFLERYMQAYAEEITEFIDAIVKDKNTPVNADDGLKPVLIGLAAQKSLKENRPVKISEIKF